MIKNYVFRIVMMLVIVHSAVQANEIKKSESATTQKKYKNIIFDLGGVLVDWNPVKFINQILPGAFLIAILLRRTRKKKR